MSAQREEVWTHSEQEGCGENDEGRKQTVGLEERGEGRRGKGGCLGKEVSHSTCTDQLLSHVSSFHVFLSLQSRAAYIIWRSLLTLSLSRGICIRPPKALYSTVVPSAHPYLQVLCFHLLVSPDKWRFLCHCRHIQHASSSSLYWTFGMGGFTVDRRQLAAPAELSCLLSDRNHGMVYRTKATSRVGIGVVTVLGNASDIDVSVMHKKY